MANTIWRAKRVIWTWVVDAHNDRRQRAVAREQRKRPCGYYALYHGFWCNNLNVKQNIEKCKNEKMELRKNKKIRR